MFSLIHRIPTFLKYFLALGLGIGLIVLGSNLATSAAVTGGSIISSDYTIVMHYDEASQRTSWEGQAKVFNGDHYTMEVIQFNIETTDTLGVTETRLSENIPCNIAPGQNQIITFNFALAGEFLSLKIVSWSPTKWQNGFQTAGGWYIAATAFYVALDGLILILAMKNIHYKKFYWIVLLVFLLELAPLVLLAVNWYLFSWITTAVSNGFSGLLFGWAVGYSINAFADAGLFSGGRKKLYKDLKKILIQSSGDVSVGGIKLSKRISDTIMICGNGYQAYFNHDFANVHAGKSGDGESIVFPIEPNYCPKTAHGRRFLEDFPYILMKLRDGCSEITGKKYKIKGFYSKNNVPSVIDERG